MDKVIAQFIKKVKKDKDILAVAFFGSYARGEKYNDIDICIFLNPGNYSSLTLSKKKLEYSSGEKLDVQVFQQLPVYIQERILKEGKIIYCGDEDALYDLYFSSIREIESFKPMYEDYLAGVVHG